MPVKQLPSYVLEYWTEDTENEFGGYWTEQEHYSLESAALETFTIETNWSIRPNEYARGTVFSISLTNKERIGPKELWEQYDKACKTLEQIDPEQPERTRTKLDAKLHTLYEARQLNLHQVICISAVFRFVQQQLQYPINHKTFATNYGIRAMETFETFMEPETEQ